MISDSRVVDWWQPRKTFFRMFNYKVGSCLLILSFWNTMLTLKFVVPQNSNDKGCGFLERLEPPVCVRSKYIIPGLLKKLNSLKNSEHVWFSNGYVGQGPRSPVIESSDVIGLIARDRLKWSCCFWLLFFYFVWFCTNDIISVCNAIEILW